MTTPNANRQVEIIEYDALAKSAKVRATCQLDEDGTVAISGDEKMAARLKAGLFSPKTGGRVTPENGQDFLEAILLEFKNPYLLAREK